MQKYASSINFAILVVAVLLVFSSIIFNPLASNFVFASTNEEQETIGGIENQTDNMNIDTNTDNQETVDEQSDTDSNAPEENTDISIETLPESATNTYTTQKAQLSQPSTNILIR